MVTAAQLASANDQRLRAEEALAASQRRIADLERLVQELESRCAQVAADRQADRLEFHEMVRTEQSKYAALVSDQAQRAAALADISRLLQDAASRTERLLGGNTEGEAPQVAGTSPAPESNATPPAAAGFGEEAAWQF
jgi:hypothetical protein